MNIYAGTNKMIRTPELLEEVKKSIGNDTIYSLAKVFEVSRNTVKFWLNDGVMTDANALRAADITNLDPGYVLYSMAAERAEKKGDDRLFNFWKEKADQIGPALLSASACLLMIFMEIQPLV